MRQTSDQMLKNEDGASLSLLWQIVGSLAVHLLLVLLIWSLPVATLPPEPEETPIVVEFVPPEPPAQTKPTSSAPSQFKILTGEAEDKVAAQPDAPTLPDDGMIRPTRMLSGSVLNQANNKLARQALREIPRDERREQYCTLEAMEQLAEWDKRLRPDLLLSYIFEETQREGNMLIANGAAMMSKGIWYYLSYECILSEDLTKVTDFAFKLGDPVPRHLWDGHGLVDQVMDTTESVERYNAKTRQ